MAIGRRWKANFIVSSKDSGFSGWLDTCKNFMDELCFTKAAGVRYAPAEFLSTALCSSKHLIAYAAISYSVGGCSG
jgi:hypothetical protein